MQIPASLPLFRYPVDLKLFSLKAIAVVWVRSHCLPQEMILASPLPSLPRPASLCTTTALHTPPTTVPGTHRQCSKRPNTLSDHSHCISCCLSRQNPRTPFQPQAKRNLFNIYSMCSLALNWERSTLRLYIVTLLI